MIQGNSIPHFPLPLNASSSSLSVNREIRCSSASVKPDTPTDQKAILFLWCNKTFWILQQKEALKKLVSSRAKETLMRSLRIGNVWLQGLITYPWKHVMCPDYKRGVSPGLRERYCTIFTAPTFGWHWGVKWWPCCYFQRSMVSLLHSAGLSFPSSSKGQSLDLC